MRHNMSKTHQSQFELMVDFMERHGDIKWTGCIGPQNRLQTLNKWHELVRLLNKQTSRGAAKSINKWRKAWSDYKNNTKRKAEKIRNGAFRLAITPLEKRVLMIIAKKKENKNRTLEDSEFKFEVDSDTCQRTSSPPQPYFASVDDLDQVTQERRKSSSSSFSRASLEDRVRSVSPRKKRRKTDVIPADVKEITDIFKYEREKDKMAHEQEMARIKQNEKLLAIVGRMVNVIETLAPSLKKYLNQDTNGDG